jgi:hypothetical protein
MLPLQHLRLRSAFIPSFSVLSALLANRPGHIEHVTDEKAAMSGPGGGRLRLPQAMGGYNGYNINTERKRLAAQGVQGRGPGGWGR